MGRRVAAVARRRNAIAVNGSYFNTHRMVQQYAMNAYGVESGSGARERAAVEA